MYDSSYCSQLALNKINSVSYRLRITRPPCALTTPQIHAGNSVTGSTIYPHSEGHLAVVGIVQKLLILAYILLLIQSLIAFDSLMGKQHSRTFLYVISFQREKWWDAKTFKQSIIWVLKSLFIRSNNLTRKMKLLFAPRHICKLETRILYFATSLIKLISA